MTQSDKLPYGVRGDEGGDLDGLRRHPAATVTASTAQHVVDRSQGNASQALRDTDQRKGAERSMDMPDAASAKAS